MNKKTISMLVLGLLLGGGAIGAYQAGAQSKNAVKAQASAEQQETQDPSYKGSITIDETRYEGKNEQDESKALAGSAKITAEQAKQAAEAKVGGTASKVELGNENGNLVYEVNVGKKEVKVDAGNKSVLKVEQNDGEEEGENENDKDRVENENDTNEQAESNTANVK